MVSISVLMPTARDNYPIIGLEDLHILTPTFYSLEKQTFRDFEVILVDALFPQKRDWIEDRIWSFPVKYVAPHPNHRFWLDRKRWSVAGMLNTGILHAEGELLVRVDDCSQFGPDFLQRFWEGYEKGFFPLAMHTRFRNGKQAYYTEEYRQQGYEFQREKPDRQEVLEKFYGKGQPIRDTRWLVVEQRGGSMIAPPIWYYGYSSMSLEAALKVNGYDEAFDGSKSLEDCDMGSRLSMAGYVNLFLLDVNHWVIEHEHEAIPPEVIAPDAKPMVCNYGIYLLNESRGRWRANSERLSLQDCEWVRQVICPRCGNRQRCLGEYFQGRFFIEDEDFNMWLTAQRVFDLREERLSL
jgi:hypothetical protein